MLEKISGGVGKIWLIKKIAVFVMVIFWGQIDQFENY